MFQIIVMNKKISQRQSFDPQILVSLWEGALVTKGALPYYFFQMHVYWSFCIFMFFILPFSFL